MKLSNSKKIAKYSIFTTAALIFGYVEFLLPLNFIAPGVKLGMANAIILFLILHLEFKTAFAVNIVRIILSALVFATPFSLLFSFTAGVISTLVMITFSRCKKLGVIGVSVLGGVSHNLVQLVVADFTIGNGVWFYLPFLLFAGIVASAIIGLLVFLIDKKININVNY